MTVRRHVTAAVFIGVLASLVASSPASADGFPVEPLSKQCTGAGFETTTQDAKTAHALMAGQLTLPGFGSTKLEDTPTWHENPFKSRNWDYQYHALRWLDPLRREAVRTQDTAMLQRYQQLLEGWFAANPFSKRATEDPMAWYDMGVGLRAIGLVCAQQVVGDQGWLTDAMTEEAAVLSDPTQYRTQGNHGLHQNKGLLALGCLRDDDTWKALALKRASTLALRSIDDEGVTDEGSSVYEMLNYSWYAELRQQIHDCDLKPLPALDRLDRMPSFIAQSIAPNGELVGFGDSSPLSRPAIIAKTTEQYAATRGDSGTRPRATFAVYKRGYLFSRVTWRAHSESTSFLTLRFGQSRHEQVHGHDDAGDITFYALGKELLWGNGSFTGGTGGALRTYLTSRAAQNTVDVPSVAYDRDAHSVLVRAKTTSSFDLATVTSRTLTGVSTQRTVVHAKEGGFLVVDDQVKQSKSRTVVQRWQLEEDRTTVIHAARIATGGSGTNSVLLWVGTKPHLHVIEGRTKPTVEGWRSDHSTTIVPSPTAEASVNGKRVRLTMVLIPRAAGRSSIGLRITGSRTSGTTRQFDVHTGSGTYRVRLTASSASVVKL